MGRVDKDFEIIRWAVRSMRRVKQYTVIAPATFSAKLCNGQDFPSLVSILICLRVSSKAAAARPFRAVFAVSMRYMSAPRRHGSGA
jgi:hypothetical protein